MRPRQLSIPGVIHYELSLLLSGMPKPTSSDVTESDNRSVKVTTVITGGVKSRITRTDRDLSPNSLYRPIDPEYQRRTKHSQEGAMPHEDYARSVVSQILLGPWPWRWLWPSYRKYIWEGNRSSLIKFLTGGWLWFGLFERAFTRMFALWKLKRVN
jgi:1-acylglycerone phosphate reductase